MPFLRLTYILASNFQPLFFRHRAFFLQMGKNVTLFSFHSNTCNFCLVRKKNCSVRKKKKSTNKISILDRVFETIWWVWWVVPVRKEASTYIWERWFSCTVISEWVRIIWESPKVISWNLASVWNTRLSTGNPKDFPWYMPRGRFY